MWYELIPGLAIMAGVTFASFNIYKLEQMFIAKGKVNIPFINCSEMSTYSDKTQFGQFSIHV